MLTRIFKSGNSLAVRIPKELAFLDPTAEVEIERVGNTLVLRPVERETLADVPAIFASFSPDFMAGGREFHEQKEREWSGVFSEHETQPETDEPPRSASGA
jgi:antitoxin VapB